MPHKKIPTIGGVSPPAAPDIQQLLGAMLPVMVPENRRIFILTGTQSASSASPTSTGRFARGGILRSILLAAGVHISDIRDVQVDIGFSDIPLPGTTAIDSTLRVIPSGPLGDFFNYLSFSPTPFAHWIPVNLDLGNSPGRLILDVVNNLPYDISVTIGIIMDEHL